MGSRSRGSTTSAGAASGRTAGGTSDQDSRATARRRPVAAAGPSQRLSEALRARGYRVTAQRRLVLAALEERGPCTPEEVLAATRGHAVGVNLSTVYRTLELLEGLGLVAHTHLGHGAPTYHAARAREHAHLVCRGCGRVVDLGAADVAPLTDRLARRHGFAVDVSHLAVEGHCARCRSVPDPT